jgi:hypothetical protein
LLSSGLIEYPIRICCASSACIDAKLPLAIPQNEQEHCCSSCSLDSPDAKHLAPRLEPLGSDHLEEGLLADGVSSDPHHEQRAVAVAQEAVIVHVIDHPVHQLQRDGAIGGDDLHVVVEVALVATRPNGVAHHDQVAVRLLKSEQVLHRLEAQTVRDRAVGGV